MDGIGTKVFDLYKNDATLFDRFFENEGDDNGQEDDDQLTSQNNSQEEDE